MIVHDRQNHDVDARAVINLLLLVISATYGPDTVLING